ncbi:hypothetical protein M431DRAFT_404517 [Trichoderma harzianum CBS 226.95]|uniref:Uncharacterized protein n=1 Tax=Trichoderma harzianum CBS 226.95 TaxID=983964 RepID=A0A2T4AET3_TRIHA|nr:hypothetical protein M431DRAFT_404517 [Trichoderma harzianum CBS 226.95]PTB55590.1 hypothetical protein M431DRAFT_404517 [Trichoderma harzianum CBS 226.95]
MGSGAILGLYNTGSLMSALLVSTLRPHQSLSYHVYIVCEGVQVSYLYERCLPGQRVPGAAKYGTGLRIYLEMPRVGHLSSLAIHLGNISN